MHEEENVFHLCSKSLKCLYNVWHLNCQTVIVLVAPKSNYRATDIQTDDSLNSKHRDPREAYLAQAVGEEGEEVLVYARQNGVGSDSEKYEPHDADVQAKFVDLIAECSEQVENLLRVSGAVTGSGAFGTDATGRPEWC